MQQSSGAADPTAAAPTAAAPTAAAPMGFEMGWSEEHLCAWRKEVKGPKLRGPLELSQKPTVDETVDPDSPVICTFHDGQKFEVAHVSMVTRMEPPLADIFVGPFFSQTVMTFVAT